jgi:protein-S-isoprenylcysteine O-methyltransferase Ste14
MDRAYPEIIFLSGLVLQVIIHVHYIQSYTAERQRNYFNKKENVVLLFVLVSFQLIPFFYVFSDWFSFFDYSLPKWLNIPPTMLYCFGIWLFCRAYSDLGSFWSPGLEIKKDHRLVTTGVFKRVRHPMYSALIVIAVAQVFMLQNWIAGPSFLLLAVPFYLSRIKREERQLIYLFGDEYRIYKQQTNALFPKKEKLVTAYVPLLKRLTQNWETKIKSIRQPTDKKQKANHEEK